MKYFDLSQSFKFYLSSDNLSSLSRKNYLSDFNHFFSWLIPFFKQKGLDLSGSFDPSLFKNLSFETINEYKNFLLDNKIPDSTINRRLSTLRKFAKFCLDQKIVETDFSENLSNISRSKKPISDSLPNFEEVLERYSKRLFSEKNSPVTVKNYLLDTKNFLFWLSQITSDSTKEALNKITPIIIAEYQDRLINTARLSPRSVNRKLSSLRKFCQFVNNQGYLAENPFERQPIKTTVKWPEIGNISIFKKPNFAVGISKNIFAPQDISQKGWPYSKKLLFNLKYTRPKWYRSYNESPLANYFHWAILIIFCVAIGLGLYQQWVLEPPKKPQLAVGPATPPLYLSFQGRLTDTIDTPIISPTWFTFAIYNDEIASGSARLWNETKRVTPNDDGVFNTLLGDTIILPSNIFKDNTALWLGVTVEDNPEMADRQPIATVAYAFNSEFLKGYPIASIANDDPTSTAGAEINTIPVINPYGNLVIAAASPSLRSTSGLFRIDAKTMYITTDPSQNGSINLNPGGTGTVNLFTANTFGNALNATSSALTTGSLIYGGVVNDEVGYKFLQFQGGSTLVDKFSIDALGGTEIANNLGVKGAATIGGILKLSSSAVDALDIAGGLYAGTDDALKIDTKGQIRIGNFSEDPSAIGNGSIIYNTSSNKLRCYINNTWIDCDSATGDGNYWALANGALYPQNSTTDLFIGGAASASANFAFLNVNSGTPTASFSSNLVFAGGSRTITATDLNDLTLGNSLTKNLILNPSKFIGIGTTSPDWKLHVSDSQLATASAMIENTAANQSSGHAGLLIRLGETSSPTQPNNSDRFINFLKGDGTIVGKIMGNSGTGVEYSSLGTDFAEYFTKETDTNYEEGEVISLGSSDKKVIKSQTPYDQKLIGVVSAHPGFSGGEEGPNKVLVGVAGQVPVKIAPSSSPISVGDLLTSSEVEGKAIRATQAGIVFGKAMENWSPASEKETILVYLNLSWFDPTAFLTNAGEIEINNPDSIYEGLLLKDDSPPTADRLRSTIYSLKDKSGEIVQRVANFAEIASAKIKAGLIETKNLITENLVAVQANIINLRTDLLSSNQIISPLIESEEIQTKKLVVKDTIISPLVDTEEVITNNLAADKIISPLISVTSLQAEEATISSLITEEIDTTSLRTETIQAENLNSEVATIAGLTSGEIHTGKIFADEIISSSFFPGQEATVAASYITNITNLNTINNIYEASPSAGEIDIDALLAELANQGLNLGVPVDIATLSAELASIENDFKVLGRTSLASTSVAGTFTQDGTLVFEEGNRIDVLGGDSLYLQKGNLGGVNIADGKVIISKEGNLTVSGDLTVKGKFSIKNSQDFEIASLDASGSATAKEFKIIREVQADSSPLEIVADSSAGTGQITAYHSQVLIKTSYAHKNSLIYLTPVGPTKGQVLYLANIKPEEGFTVAVDSQTLEEVKFNWWIIN